MGIRNKVEYAIDGLNHGDHLISYEFALDALDAKNGNLEDLEGIAEAAKNVSIQAKVMSNYFAEIAENPHLANHKYRAVN
jgi:hypothetical protein